MTKDKQEEQQPAAPLQVMVHTQYVRDLSFESPAAPDIFVQNQAQPTIDLGINVQTRMMDAHTHEVMLMIKLTAKTDTDTAFIVELAYGGVFGLPTMEEAHKKLFLLIEAPRLLFPFARNIVANAVRDGGFPQVLINPIDFGMLYQQQMEQQQGAAAPANQD
ncbi:MAG: protein-export chaperone SecB [Alphaproteobacteria bacterium]|nr:protein-export chaperone SecB [Alphaproteobacteria bacterium]